VSDPEDDAILAGRVGHVRAEARRTDPEHATPKRNPVTFVSGNARVSVNFDPDGGPELRDPMAVPGERTGDFISTVHGPKRRKTYHIGRAAYEALKDHPVALEEYASAARSALGDAESDGVADPEYDESGIEVRQEQAAGKPRAAARVGPAEPTPKTSSHDNDAERARLSRQYDETGGKMGSRTTFADDLKKFQENVEKDASSELARTLADVVADKYERLAADVEAAAAGAGSAASNERTIEEDRRELVEALKNLNNALGCSTGHACDRRAAAQAGVLKHVKHLDPAHLRAHRDEWRRFSDGGA
jgi:hypothetical protein